MPLLSPPIITDAHRPLVSVIHSHITMIQHIQSPGETVTRQQGLDIGSSELMALPQPAPQPTNYPFLCQHGRKSRLF